MALATHHLQGSYRRCPLSFSSGSTGNKLKISVTNIQTVGWKDNFISLKCKPCLRIGAPLILKPKGKSLKISAFKSNSKNESGSRGGGSKSLKNSVKLSYVPQESEETSVESPRAQNVPIHYSAEADENSNYSAIQNIFKSWLTLLRTPSPSQVMDETVEEPHTTEMPETAETPKLVQEKERGRVLKAVWCYFMSLDATIKFPVLTFVPTYLVVTLAYGVEVSKDMTPVWILFPLVVALYVKMLQVISRLYVFSFKQTANVIGNSRRFALLTYDFVARGKLKEEIRMRVIQPLVDMDYKELAKRKAKELQVDLMERYLDYIESVWPYYCRLVRLLKKAKLL